MVSKGGWSRKFDDPIPLPDGHQLVTLEDAGNYITKLPKAEHEAQEWQAAMEALILVAELGGPTMFARIGIMRALNRGKPGPANFGLCGHREPRTSIVLPPMDVSSPASPHRPPPTTRPDI